jgi:phosphoadenosine phosphosulfate reductase
MAPAEAKTLAERLAAETQGFDAAQLLRHALGGPLAGRIALVSSFGAEAAVLLHLVATIDAATPVVFADTEKLFGETLRYRAALVARFGLRDVRTFLPDPARLAEVDGKGILWAKDRDLCCHVRKVEPLARGLAPFDGWISGRKRFQAATRAALPLVEIDGAKVKFNPLATWTPADLAAYAAEHDLPPHPLIADGYPSIGCMPCTDRVQPGEDARAGRWRGSDKTECGIHLGFGLDGTADAARVGQ